MDIFCLHNRKIGEMSIIGFVAMGSILLKDSFISLEVSYLLFIFALSIYLGDNINYLKLYVL